MATVQHSTAFTVQYVTETNNLAKLLPALDEQISHLLQGFAATASCPLPGAVAAPTLNPQRVTYQTSQMETGKFRELIPRLMAHIDHGVPFPPKMPTDVVDYSCKVVVSYDSEDNPQAYGLMRDNQTFKGEKAVELYSLTNAFRNLPNPQGKFDPLRVKGAGSSIINFFKEECKTLGAKYLYLEAAPNALDFYKRHHFQVEKTSENLLDHIPEGQRAQILANAACMQMMNSMQRTPMFFEIK